MSRSNEILKELDEIIRVGWGPRKGIIPDSGEKNFGWTTRWRQLIARNFPEAGPWLGETTSNVLKYGDNLMSYVSQWSNLTLVIAGFDMEYADTGLEPDPSGARRNLHQRGEYPVRSKKHSGWVSHYCFHGKGFTKKQRLNKLPDGRIYIGDDPKDVLKEAPSEIYSLQDLLDNLKYEGTYTLFRQKDIPGSEYQRIKDAGKTHMIPREKISDGTRGRRGTMPDLGVPGGKVAQSQDAGPPKIAKSIGSINIRISIPQDPDQWGDIYHAIKEYIKTGQPVVEKSVENTTISVYKRGDVVIVDWYDA